MAPRRNNKQALQSNKEHKVKVKHLFHGLLLPLLFTLAIWLLAYKGGEEVNKIVNIKPYLPFYSEKTVKELLPPHPSNLYQTWQFAQWEYELRLLSENKSTISGSDKEDILIAASALAARPVTEELLLRMSKYVKEIDEEKGLISKVMGFFSFVNVIWALSFLGILITCSPVLYIVARPIYQMIGSLVYVIYPILTSSIAIQIYHIIGYVLLFLWQLGATQYNDDVAYLLSFFSFATLSLLIFYTCGTHYMPIYYSINHKDKEQYAYDSKAQRHKNEYIQLFLLSVSFPLTLLHSSSLFGWIAVINFFATIGFSVGCYGLCYVIGFDGEEAIARCVISSLSLIATFTGLKIAGVHSSYFIPFASPCVTFGAVVYFLGLLIMSSRFSKNGYLPANLLFFLSIVLCMLIGNVYYLPSITNTAYTFLILWILEKFCELDMWRKSEAGLWIMFFFLSIILFCLAFYLHAHPELIFGMFDSDWLVK